MNSVTSIEIVLPNSEKTYSSWKPQKGYLTYSYSNENFYRCENTIRKSLPVSVLRTLDKQQSKLLSFSTEELESYIDDLQANHAWKKTLKLIERKDYTTHEISTKLKTAGFCEVIIQGTIERALSLKFLDDDRYALMYISAKKSQKWGERKIEQYLLKKGIDPKTLPGWPEAFFESADLLDNAQQLLVRKNIPEKNSYDKLMRFLISKGYDYAIAKEAVLNKLSGDLD